MALSGRALAEAYVRVRADMSQVAQDVRTGTQRAVDTAGASTARGLKDAITKPLRAGLADAGKTAGTAGTAAGGKFRDGVASRMKATAADAAAAGRESGRRFSDAQTVSVHEGGVRFSETIREGFKASLIGLTAGLAGLGAIEVFKSFIDGANEARKASALTRQVLISTGGAAHVTAGDVEELSRAISDKTGVDDDAIHSAANLLLTFTNVRNEVGRGNDVFNQATGIITDMSVALGQDMSSSAIQLGKALNDPINGITALQRVGVSFTAQQKAQIAEMVKSGHTLEAQKTILAELGREFGGAAAAASTPLQKLQVHIENIGKALAGSLLPAVDKTATVINDLLLPGIEHGIGVLGSIPAPVYAGVGAFVAFSLALRGVSAAMAAFTAIGGIQGVVGGLRVGLVGLIGILTSPWTIALAGAAVAVGLFVNHLQQVHAEEESLRATLDQTTGAITTQTTAWISQQLSQAGALSNAQRLGLSLGDVTLAAEGNAAALARVNAALDGAIARGGPSTATAVHLRVALNELTGTVKGQVAAQQQQAAAQSQAKTATEGATGATDRIKAAYAAARDALTKWSAAMIAASDQFLAGRQTERAYRDAIDAATAAVKANGHSLSDNTAKGRANEAALDAVTSSGRAYLKYLVDSKAPGSAVRAEWEAQRRKLLDVYMQFVHNKDKALDYVNHALGKVPPKVTTRVLTPGLDSAQRAFEHLTSTLKALPSETVRIRVNADGTATSILTAGSHVESHILRAAGGIVSGPGGPRDDKINARLSNGEFVVNAASTGRHRELLEAINSRGYAAGGLVRVPTSYSRVPRDLDVVFGRGLAALGSAAGFGGGPVPGGAGVARWGPMVHRALALLGESQGLWDNWMRQIATESGGNPSAINLTDSNAKAGHPSQGLLQTIPSTFAAYHVPGTSWNINDGWANMLAAMNYGKHRYGSSQEAQIGHGHGYAAGTGSAAPGWAWVGESGRELVRFAGGEQVKSATASRAYEADAGTVRLHPDDLATLGAVLATALTAQPIVLDGRTLAGYVDRRFGVSSLSVRG